MKMYMEESDFKNIFGSQIAEGEISADWRTKYKGIIKQPPNVNQGLQQTATSKFAGV